MNLNECYRGLALRKDPFPFGVLDDWLPRELAEALANEFPDLGCFSGGRRLADSQKLELCAHQALQSPEVGIPWRELITALTSREHLQTLSESLAAPLEAEYPDLAQRLSAQSDLRIGLRYRDGFASHDLLLDAVLTVHAPNRRGAATDRGPHLKIADKPIVGILLLRRQGDDSTGGDLEVFRWDGAGTPQVGRHNVVSDQRRLRRVARIERVNNRLLLFINTPRSIQGFSIRPVTPHPLIYLHFVVQTPGPLFQPRLSLREGLARRVRGWLGGARK